MSWVRQVEIVKHRAKINGNPLPTGSAFFSLLRQYTRREGVSRDGFHEEA